MNYDYLIFHTIDFVYQTPISILFNLFTLSIYINLWKSTCIQCFFFFPCVLYFHHPTLSMPIKLPVIQSFLVVVLVLVVMIILY